VSCYIWYIEEGTGWGPAQGRLPCTKSSSSSLFVQIKIHDANKEQMIIPEQDSKVEKTTLTAALD